MASKKVGALVKEARTAAGLTQEKLAKKAGEGLTAADISKCEQGKADLTNAQLKKIAVACGVTQSSLVNATKNVSSSAKKTTTEKKTTTAKKTSSTSSKKTTSSTKKTSSSASSTKKTSTTPANANTSMKVTSTEKKVIEAYREAPSDLKKAALKVLKGEYGDTINKLLSASSGSGTTAADGIGEMLGDFLGGLLGGNN